METSSGAYCGSPLLARRKQKREAAVHLRVGAGLPTGLRTVALPAQ
jgi:hypothetical protein